MRLATRKMVDRVGFEPTRRLGAGVTVPRFQPLTHLSVSIIGVRGRTQTHISAFVALCPLQLNDANILLGRQGWIRTNVRFRERDYESRGFDRSPTCQHFLHFNGWWTELDSNQRTQTGRRLQRRGFAAHPSILTPIQDARPRLERGFPEPNSGVLPIRRTGSARFPDTRTRDPGPRG